MSEKEKVNVIEFPADESDIEGIQQALERDDEGDKLSTAELRTLMDSLKPASRQKVLLVGEHRVEALRQLMRLLSDGVLLRYHGEILETMSVYSSPGFSPEMFAVVEREDMGRLLGRMQLPMKGMGR